MMTKVYIVERDQELISKIHDSIASNNLLEATGSSTSFEAAIRDINARKPDIIVSSIELDDHFTVWHLNKELGDKNHDFILLSATDDEQKYLKSRKVEGSKFLVKPFGMQSLRGMLEDIHKDNLLLSAKIKAKKNVLFVKKDKSYNRLNLEDILYFYSEGNYVTLVTADQSYIFKYALTKLLALDKFNNFVRVHRSYAVNTDKVTKVSIGEKQLSLDKIHVPFGRTFVQNVRNIVDTGLK